MEYFFKTVLAGIVGIGALLGFGHTRVESPTTSPTMVSHEVIHTHEEATTSPIVKPSASEAAVSTPATSPIVKNKLALSDSDILALADTKYADGNVPLGDYKYVTDKAKKGYIYLCNVRKDNPGSMVTGPWVHGTTWNWNEKVIVDGSVSWPNATFSNIVKGAIRTLTTKSLPINHTTGVYPVASTDDAHNYDPNPNTISAQNIMKELPANPTYSETPYCMGGEVGIMLTGVPLFNAFDAGLRDAPAHELQDSCNGHPQGSGEYHYHSDSACFKNESVKTVLGYAYDGFPITGSLVSGGKYLTTEDLDECHGITSDITVDGVTKTSYHYVLTKDFPYSASCFRAKPISQAMSMTPPQGGQGQQGMGQGGQGMPSGMMPPPPMR